MSKIVKSMISYSSSFEDVILQRALQHVAHGCYVDVGASAPIADSNTAAFYRRGWRGICVEPIKEWNTLWVEQRPDDIFINAAAGSMSGEVDFYFCASNSQVSTCSTDRVSDNEYDHQLPYERRNVPMITLNQAMEQFLDERTIHVLSIDVEGYEKQVLQGFDLQQYCPWVIVVEAILPATHAPAYQSWEGNILEAGYTMVYEDGINRFYLSNTKPELLEHFVSPPNVWDGFITADQLFAQMEIDQLEKNNKQLLLESDAIKKMIDGEVDIPSNFWNYVPHLDANEQEQKLVELKEENKNLKEKLNFLK